MLTTYKFRLYPSKEQEGKMLEVLDKCRFVYNKLLENLNKQDKPNRFELQKTIPKLKEKYLELKEVYSKILQYESYRLFSNLRSLARLRNNGKKVGRLRFKGKGWFKTFVYNQSGFKIIKTGKRLDLLHLSKIGNVPIRIHKEIKGKVKQVVIKKHPSEKWFACLSIENEPLPNQITNKVIGLDVGVKYFLTDSDGRQIENPKFYEKSLKRIMREHKKLSKKKKSSKNCGKQKIKLAKTYEKLVNQRNDFLHKLSRFYVNNYDIIAVEDLNIKNMVGNHLLASKILDASWGKFVQMLSYKAARAGKVVVKVDPRGTSKEYKYGKLDRDYNASLNILKRGLEKVGMGQAEFTPVETEPLLVRASSVVEVGSSLQ